MIVEEKEAYKQLYNNRIIYLIENKYISYKYINFFQLFATPTLNNPVPTSGTQPITIDDAGDFMSSKSPKSAASAIIDAVVSNDARNNGLGEPDKPVYRAR